MRQRSRRSMVQTAAAYHVSGQLSGLIHDGCPQDFREALAAVYSQLVAVLVDDLLSAEPLPEVER